MARTIRKSGMKEVALSEIKDDLSRYLREAETQEIVITPRQVGRAADRIRVGGGLVRVSPGKRSALSPAN